MQRMVNETCDGTLHRLSCQLSDIEYGELDSVAGIRIIVSCLSLMGTTTVILLTIIRREALNPKVHPIFVLSIADSLLALLYIIGGSLWLRTEATTVSSRIWCFAATLPTVILQCVTVNLTVIYALLAYAGVRQKYTGNHLRDGDLERHVWSPFRTTISYLVAWFEPMVTVLVLFSLVVLSTGVLERVEDCSCWCKPTLGNIIPSAKPWNNDTLRYVMEIRQVTVSLAAIVATHFLAGFIVLVIIYYLMIKTIRLMRLKARRQSAQGNYGTMHLTEPQLIQAEKLARRRVIYFLIVFIVTGLFNLVLCVELIVFDVVLEIRRSDMTLSKPYEHQQNWLLKGYYITLCLQSVTITQQGFLNAIVYGWTREDFLNIMAVRVRVRSCGGLELSTDLTSEMESEDEEDEAVGGPEEDRTPLTTRRKGTTEENSLIIDSDIEKSLQN